MTEFRRLPLGTGVTLNVGLQGDRSNPAVILLHGFPESHRTWRAVAPQLEDEFFLVMPDQRGFAGSDRPQDVGAYKTDALIDDIFALADALALESFDLVGHDWGGAIAWGAAFRADSRLTRLAIVNAPHPVVFQKSLIESPDQRAASQYITAFRTPGFDKIVETNGYRWFFDRTFSSHTDITRISGGGEAAVHQRMVAARRLLGDVELVSWVKNNRAATGGDRAVARLPAPRLP